MMDLLERTRRFLWLFVELGFLTVLSVILIYLILGDSSGVFVKSVADNVMKFAGAVPTASLIGFAVIVAIIYLVMQRLPEVRRRDLSARDRLKSGSRGSRGRTVTTSKE
jgi:nitrate reductase gamma subunit